MGQAGCDTSRNHWSIVLILEGEGEASVRLNMSLADGGYENGTFAVTDHQYAQTTISQTDDPRITSVTAIPYSNSKCRPSIPSTPHLQPKDVVIKVRFVVHNLGLEGWDKSRNHWSIFLVLQGGMSSVRLNMMSLAHEADENRTFSLNIYKYILPHNSLAYLDCDAFPSLTVSGFLKTVFGDLKEEGYIRPSDDDNMYLHALRLKDAHSFTNIHTYNVRMAVYIAREKITCWANGLPVEHIPEHEVRDWVTPFEAVRFMRTAGNPAILAQIRNDPVPPLF
ncbi:hypothetical protein FQN52_001867 [Onygenales sp. PD_12]|nr:hypothetical protein FQN52_001867 [Onygenales sp. PD_12]